MDKNAFLQAKSIHVFAWAFEIKQKNKFNIYKSAEKATKEFRNQLVNWGWKKKDFNVLNPDGKINNDIFMLKQYFSEPAEAIYFHPEESNAICTVYEYPLEKEDVYYHIKKGNACYELPIEGIELHVYNCGIGILFFKTLNFSYYSIQELKAINDYGRRIKIAYVPQFKNSTRIWADEVGLKILDSKGNIKYSSIMKYEKIIGEILAGVNEDGNVNKIMGKAEFLCDVLYGRFGFDKKEADDREKTFEILSYSDDRMFLISMIRDNALSTEVKSLSNLEDEQNKKELSMLQEKIYSIVYADPSDATCQDTLMRSELLKKSLYKRWLTWGSLSGVTSYSYVTITTNGNGINEGVVRPFYKEYIYLVSLVLAQRIEISVFSQETAKNAQLFNGNKALQVFRLGRQAALQKRYIIFKNQMLLAEPTCQEQGIDIYKLLQKQLFVDEEQTVLESQLQSLYESININWENFVSIAGSFFALIASAWSLYKDWKYVQNLFNWFVGLF